jgi:predicted RNA-binding Zn-ribbon protein involved in translation (DUF1610 family)
LRGEVDNGRDRKTCCHQKEQMSLTGPSGFDPVDTKLLLTKTGHRPVHFAVKSEAINNREEIDMMTISKNETESTQLRFVCPRCGGNGILENMNSCETINVHEDYYYGGDALEWWEFDKVTYSCSDCSWTIVDENDCLIKDENSLIAWLNRQSRLGAVSLRDSVEPNEENCEAYQIEVGEVRFVCPKCGGNQLDNVIHTTTPLLFQDDGSIERGELYYDDDTYHFRCHFCHWIIEDDEHGRIDDITVLEPWIKANCGQNTERILC